MENNTAYNTTITIDDVAGQDGLTDYENSALKAAGINPNLLSAEDLKTIKLELPAHSDRLQKIHGAFVGDQEGAIEKALDDNKSDTPHPRHEKQLETFSRDKVMQTPENDDDGDDDDDDSPTVLTKKPEIVYNGHAELPTRADKTPDMSPANNNETESNPPVELKPEGWLDDARERSHLSRHKYGSQKWVDIISVEDKDTNRPWARATVSGFK